MNRTPLLRQLREQGATLYIFPSASEDIGLNLDSRVNSAALSHYALLKIPNFTTEGCDGNNYLAEQLLNYVMNFETVLLNLDNYNYQEYETVSEKVFWHWAIKLGWLTVLEKDDSDYKYNDNNFIQCFGSIDAGNTLSTEFGMFNETYLNIPTSYGNGPVFLKVSNNKDYTKTNYIINHKYKSTVNNKLEGRDDENISYLTSNEPIYDISTSDEKYYQDDKSYEIVKDIFSIQKAIQDFITLSDGNALSDKEKIIINSYDDVNVDSRFQFKDTNFDITSKKCEFDFNAILLYYSVYDNSDDTKMPYAINLFGIIFLNGTNKISEDNEYSLPGLTKRKSFGGEGNNFFGNSYSFRVNIKTMSVYDNTDAKIQDNTTTTSLYSADFNDVIATLNNAVSMMNTNVYATISILEKYNEISKLLADDRTFMEDVSTKINALIHGSKTSVLKTNKLLVNTILPESLELNYIKLSLNREENIQDIDPSFYQYHPYVSPVILTNISNYGNIPAVYKPTLLLEGEIDKKIVTDDLYDNLLKIITDISINYYNYDDHTYQLIELPINTINSTQFSYLYKYFDDEVRTDGTLSNTVDSSLLYINYDALIGLIITYILQLKKDNDDLKTEIAAIKTTLNSNN